MMTYYSMYKLTERRRLPQLSSSTPIPANMTNSSLNQHLGTPSIAYYEAYAIQFRGTLDPDQGKSGMQNKDQHTVLLLR